MRIWETGPTFLKILTTLHLQFHVSNSARFSRLTAIRLFMLDGACLLAAGTKSGHFMFFRIGGGGIKLKLSTEEHANRNASIETIMVIAERLYE